ncbi:MAG: DNA replication and repair protein RecF [Saprospiraceae bacterium]
MIINHIKANFFKSYHEVTLELSDTCNVIYGNNGTGKTNFLDLLHFICLGKSYFSIADKWAIKTNEEFFRIEAILTADDDQKITMAVSIPVRGRKKIWHNGSVLQKNTEILGIIPLVCIVPDDIDLIKGSTIIRRKFMNRILCQLSITYTAALIKYERVFKQKLALMKNTPSLQELDLTLLRTYDEILYNTGCIIYQKRQEFCESYAPLFEQMYREIAIVTEKAIIKYESNFDQSTFLELSLKNRDIDFYTKRIRIGIHRDEILFFINDQNVRKYASQGQIKTFIYALKFSEYLFLSDQSKRKPILLLDDIFEKLDQERLEHLFKLMTSSKFGQIFITDTEKDRAVNILKKLSVEHKSYWVKDFKIKPSDG